MKTELLYFYMDGCPYCRQADTFLKELWEENPAYAAIGIRKVEENKEKALADSYDYFYVPCFWNGDKKLSEGAVTKEGLRKMLDSLLEINK